LEKPDTPKVHFALAMRKLYGQRPFGEPPRKRKQGAIATKPAYNRLEEVWQDLQTHGTRHHRWATMLALMAEVRCCPRKRNRNKQRAAA
jgi:hypothetical protein